MILYHGSNIKVAYADLAKCRPYKDFGQGFYLTDIREQAVQMAGRVVHLYGGAPWVSAFSFDETVFTRSDLRTLTFDKPGKDWSMFVYNNRNRKFRDFSDVLCNHDNKYDIVSGPVANDDIAYLFRTFANGLIDIETLIHGLEYKSLTTQYSFHTKKALEYLQPMED
ncbi:MAG: DUF3990 domain-containing protein [Clostridiales Family XIII bacterium]|jgi:hypothetical protein|nr:DUF3990 domain-containing protein [Clostridiales Family XIII bacterium]